MVIQASFGAAQTGPGYRFYDVTGALLGARVTAGVNALPETGSYSADAVVPAGAVGVYWDSVTTPSGFQEDLREALAVAAADQIMLVTPYVPTPAPVMVVPVPAGDESLTVVYVYTESITDEKRAGITITLRLVTTPARSERVLEIAPKTMTTDATGYAQITVQRGHFYLVESEELGLKMVIEPSDDTYNLLTQVP